MPALISWWSADCAALAPAAAPDAVYAAGADLLQRWREPQRRYHTTRHLVEMFWALEELGEAGELDGRHERTARIAAWGHDAVYSVSAPQGNEAASAEVIGRALAELGFDAATRADVARLVRASERHELPAPCERLDAAFHDADLWILAAEIDRFEEYCAQIRAEYAHVPDAVYASARRAILEPFLTRDRLYATAHAHTHWTPLARANLARELDRLG